MGRERIGFLPKTQQWNSIVEQLASYDGDIDTVLSIASDTLECIKITYEQMPEDESVIKAIKFLSTLSCSALQDHQVSFLNEHGCNVDDKISLFSLLNSAKNFIHTDYGSLEINKICKDAVLQTISTYQQNNSQEQLSLFSTDSNPIWSKVGSGAAFCDLTRSFFASFTDRQLKYYIERSAASRIDDYSSLQSFSDTLASQSDIISHHAFETSKIMQSFAAGWFNNHAKDTIPSDQQISGFLKVAFGKMREEFRREADGL